MKKYNTILTEKLQKYQHQHEASTSVSSGKNDKCEYLTGEEILPSKLKQIIEQAKFIYCSLEKDLKKQTEKQFEQTEQAPESAPEKTSKQAPKLIFESTSKQTPKPAHNQKLIHATKQQKQKLKVKCPNKTALQIFE